MGVGGSMSGVGDERWRCVLSVRRWDVSAVPAVHRHVHTQNTKGVAGRHEQMSAWPTC
jgi:hypothetical protein